MTSATGTILSYITIDYILPFSFLFYPLNSSNVDPLCNILIKQVSAVRGFFSSAAIRTGAEGRSCPQQ